MNLAARVSGFIVALAFSAVAAAQEMKPEDLVRKVTEDVQLDYLANLKQHSGEDWNHVKMTLSTAQPMLNASPPHLCMLQPILVMRGSFRPATKLTIDLLERARERFLAEPEVQGAAPLVVAVRRRG